MKLKTYSAGGVILSPTNQILIVSQYGTSWSLPKGHLEPGEDKRTAAKREIREETGIEELEWIKELGAYERHRIGRDGLDDSTELKNITLFLYRTQQVVLKPQDPDNPEAKWVQIEELKNYLTHPKDAAFLKSIEAEMRLAFRS
jgi:8-oxo-dGTP pyrophosphatase MutT (NUDIX family)